MSVEFKKLNDLGIVVISIVDNNLERLEKIKDKLLKELRLEEIHTEITIELQIIARKKPIPVDNIGFPEEIKDNITLN